MKQIEIETRKRFLTWYKSRGVFEGIRCLFFATIADMEEAFEEGQKAPVPPTTRAKAEEMRYDPMAEDEVYKGLYNKT